MLQLVRRYDAAKGGKQEFAGLSIDPVQGFQKQTFTAERQAADTVTVKDKEVKLDRYRLKLRGGDYAAWADGEGRVVRVQGLAAEGGAGGPRRVRGRHARAETVNESCPLSCNVRGLQRDRRDQCRKGTPVTDGERSLAIFIDFENLALGFQGRRDRFDIVRVLERLVEKGKIVAKKAYADWSRFAAYTAPLHEAAIELIEIPRRGQTGKNSADIRLCVDAMDLAYSKEHIDTFVVVSGDSDFSPLVSKLKELGKHVIGLGMQESTSDLLRDNCDEFIYYEDLGQQPPLPPAIDAAAAGDEAQGVRPAAGVAAGPAPREQGSALVVDGQGHDEAQEAVVQRDVPRLPHLQRAAGGRARGRAARAGDRQAQPDLRRDALRLGDDGAAAGNRRR